MHAYSVYLQGRGSLCGDKFVVVAIGEGDGVEFGVYDREDCVGAFQDLA